MGLLSFSVNISRIIMIITYTQKINCPSFSTCDFHVVRNGALVGCCLFIQFTAKP